MLRALGFILISSMALSAADVRTGIYRGRPVTFENVGGVAVYQGDMILGNTAEIEADLRKPDRRDRDRRRDCDREQDRRAKQSGVSRLSSHSAARYQATDWERRAASSCDGRDSTSA